MTTIAYRDGVMAADTLMARGNERAEGAVKIFRTEKFLVGLSGAFSNIRAFKGFLQKHEVYFDDAGALWEVWDEVPDYGDGFCAIIVDRAGQVWNAIDSPPIPVPTQFDAVGSGGTYAMGAMAMGASASEAVRIARRFDINTGGNVIVERLSV